MSDGVQNQPGGPEAPLERIQCQWCQGQNEKTATSCRS